MAWPMLAQSCSVSAFFSVSSCFVRLTSWAMEPAYAAMASHFGLVSAIAMEDTMAVLTASAGKPWAST